MDKKFEDQVAKMAFGELSEAEASEVRAHAAANADAAQMLASYEALRSDLRRLKDVPPDQLSKERLQNAILTQGLKPKPVRRSYPWAWTASGVFVVALAGLFLAKSQQPLQQQPQKQPMVMDFHRSATPSIVDKNGSVDLSMDAPLNGDDRELIEQSLIFTPSAPSRPKAVPTEDSVQSLPRNAVAITTPITRIEKNRSIRDLPNRHFRPEVSETSSTSKDDVALQPVTTPSVEKKGPDTLVLIQSDMDGNTGANNAVEVHQTEDVIVSS